MSSRDPLSEHSVEGMSESIVRTLYIRHYHVEIQWKNELFNCILLCDYYEVKDEIISWGNQARNAHLEVIS